MGCAVGFTVGLVVGFAVGFAVGLAVGLSVGFSVGVIVAVASGFNDKSGVGDALRFDSDCEAQAVKKRAIASARHSSFINHFFFICQDLLLKNSGAEQLILSFL